jgi:hypothetical protein
MLDETIEPIDEGKIPFVEGTDFYYENGLMVLTEKYLSKRGYCCGNRCRHCPYGYTDVPDHNKNISKSS